MKAMSIYEMHLLIRKRQESQVPGILKYRRGSTCCCLTVLLALLVAFIIASRKELWSHYVKVAVAVQLAHVCSTEGADFKG